MNNNNKKKDSKGGVIALIVVIFGIVMSIGDGELFPLLVLGVVFYIVFKAAKAKKTSGKSFTDEVKSATKETYEQARTEYRKWKTDDDSFDSDDDDLFSTSKDEGDIKTFFKQQKEKAAQTAAPKKHLHDAEGTDISRQAYASDSERRLAQLDGMLKSGLIDREEYKIMRRKYGL